MYSMAMVLVSLSTVNKGGDTFSKGVLAQSPFGKSLGIRLLDVVTLKPLTHATAATAIAPGNVQAPHEFGSKVGVSLVLKILFLDEEDMKSV